MIIIQNDVPTQTVTTNITQSYSKGEAILLNQASCITLLPTEATQRK